MSAAAEQPCRNCGRMLSHGIDRCPYCGHGSDSLPGPPPIGRPSPVVYHPPVPPAAPAFQQPVQVMPAVQAQPPTSGQWRWDGTSWVPPSPMQPNAGPAGAPPVYTVQPKSPVLALLLSFFLPGLGTLTNGETGKGVGILVCWFVCAVLTVFCLVGVLGAIPLWIWGMIDAYTGAQRWNSERGIIS